MAGDSTNAHIWADADVYVSFDLDAAEPADVDTDFSGAWDLVGLLDGDDGFPENRDEDVNRHYSWGGGLLPTSRSHFVLTKKFSAFEDNDTTFRLRWPGSTRGGDIVKPTPERIKIAFETRVGVTKQRYICANYAEVSPDGEIAVNETDVEKVTFEATIYPDTSGDTPVLFHHQESETGS